MQEAIEALFPVGGHPSLIFAGAGVDAVRGIKADEGVDMGVVSVDRVAMEVPEVGTNFQRR